MPGLVHSIRCFGCKRVTVTAKCQSWWYKRTNSPQKQFESVQRETISQKQCESVQRETISQKQFESVQKEVISQKQFESVQKEVISQKQFESVQKEVISQKQFESVQKEVISQKGFFRTPDITLRDPVDVLPEASAWCRLSDALWHARLRASPSPSAPRN